jgi:small subunit ribosomal protein S21
MPVNMVQISNSPAQIPNPVLDGEEGHFTLILYAGHFYDPGYSLEIFNISLYLCRPKTYQGGIIIMLIIDSKDCENIDKALKKYKKKFEKSKVLLQLRERQSFTKPSVKRRGEVLKAIYKQKIASGKIEG